ncbi:MAG: single-stranded DNA-binding protein [Candidatus Dadabacteria bacterium]|nr:MAG: single-stranded DNA-binding protein [Candidatus Dadabacteria bacterium]
MASVNKVILLGNLGHDPELRHTANGRAVTTLRIATNEQWTDPSGQRQERTEWHNVVVWGRQAETCAQYLSKGRQVFVEGRLRTQKWQDQQGNERSRTEIIADRVQFVGGPAAVAPVEEPLPEPDLPPPPPTDDDVPF